jgi:hypothetical protein
MAKFYDVRLTIRVKGENRKEAEKKAEEIRKELVRLTHPNTEPNFEVFELFETVEVHETVATPGYDGCEID